ncbi:MAG TPA: glycosyltransferase family 2 protein [Ktedonobacteraceae bacterium]|jgi:glycosyltransferase involved in cell wall biosynthesis|nr:glycosyltransferase family 2 protein [Ktedonobacteraceae bacterium]
MEVYQNRCSISVIIPTKNEAKNLPYVLPRLPACVSEVILVDGNSSDNTVEVAQQLYPSICIIKQQKTGKGGALLEGFAAATGEIIVMLDADGSADPTEIERFVEPLQHGYDFAKGSRFMKGGKSHDITLLRRTGNFALQQVVNLLFGTRFSDLCYGYNAFRRHCLERIDIHCEGFEIESLLNIRVHLAGLKITEVPSVEYPRIHGMSNLRAFKDGWKILKLILQEHSGKRRFGHTLPHLQHNTL